MNKCWLSVYATHEVKLDESKKEYKTEVTAD